MSAANTSLYGVVHAVITALGLAPGPGFVHTGHAVSFVFDTADLYKADISIPIAFDIAARDVADIGAETRRAVRDHMKSEHFLDTCVRDIKTLLQIDNTTEYGPDALDTDVVMLWDGANGAVSAGIAYSDEPGGYDDFDDDVDLPNIDDLITPGQAAMTVIVIAACPVGLRGHLTRWLLEISAGVFVGKVSARVRDLLRIRTVEMVKSGRAIMVFAADNEQGLNFKVHRHEWAPVEIEGLILMLRPNNSDNPGQLARPTGQRDGAAPAADGGEQ